MKASNQNEWTMRDEVLLIIVVATTAVFVVITVLITLAFFVNYNGNARDAEAGAALIIIFFALVLYIDWYIGRKVTMYEGGGK